MWFLCSRCAELTWVIYVQHATIWEPAVFQLLRVFAQNPRRLSQGPTKLRRSFQKVSELWDRRSWTRPHAHVGQCLSASASISACMAWIALVVLHTIGHLAPPEEQNSIDPLSPNTYRRDAPKPYRIIPPGLDAVQEAHTHRGH